MSYSRNRVGMTTGWSRGGVTGGDVFSLVSSHRETNPEGHRSSNNPGRVSGKNDDTDWVKEQETTFIHWINQHLKASDPPISITDLRSGLQDGLVLIELMKIVAPESIQFRRYHKAPKLRLLRLENVKISLECIKREGIQLLNIEPADIVDGNLKLTLGLLQSLANRYPITAGGNVPHKASTRKAMLLWLQAFLPKAHITNFTTDWKDGVLLSKLVDKLRPGLIADHAHLDPAHSLENTRLAMDYAKTHLNVPKVVSPESLCVAEPEELSVTTYLSYFCGPDSPGHEYMIDWVNQTLPGHQVINFTFDWTDGLVLCYLVDAFCQEVVPVSNVEEIGRLTATERVKVAMETAEMELSVPNSVRPSQFVNKNAEQLQRMAYIAQFMKHQKSSRTVMSVVGSNGLTNGNTNEVDTPPEPRPPQDNEEVVPLDITRDTQLSPEIEGERENTSKTNSKTSSISSLSNVREISRETREREKETDRQMEANRAQRDQKKNTLDELFAEVEMDFDSFLQQIDNIGTANNTATTTTSAINSNTASNTGTTSINSNTTAVDTKSHPSTVNQEDVPLELDFDFDFSTDTATSSEMGSRPQSVSPEPVFVPAPLQGGSSAVVRVMESDEGALLAPPTEVTHDDTLVEEEVIVMEHNVTLTDGGEERERGREEGEREEREREEREREEKDGEREEREREKEEREREKEEREGKKEREEREVNEVITKESTCVLENESPYLSGESRERGGSITADQSHVDNMIVPVAKQATPPDDNDSSYNNPLTDIIVIDKDHTHITEVGVAHHELSTRKSTDSEGSSRRESDTTTPPATPTPEPVSEHDSTSLTSPSTSTSPVPPDPADKTTPPDTPTHRLSNPQHCKVSGRGLYYGIADQPSDFVVDCSKAGRGRLEVVIESPNGDNLEADGKQVEESMYKLSFVPMKVGTHKISVVFHGQDVPNSPFSCEVSDPSLCTTSGLEAWPLVGQEGRFQVDTKWAGPGTLQTTINSNTQQPVDFKLTSCTEGLFVYNYTLPAAGTYSVDVKWVGQHVPGSPFNIVGKEDRANAAECVVLEPPGKSVRVREEVRVRVDCRNAGTGELKALLRSPKGEVTCQLAEEGGVYTVTTRPSDVGNHRLVLQYAGEDVPLSPVTLQVNDPSLVRLNIKSAITQSVSINKTFSFHANAEKCGEGSVSAIATASDAPNRPIQLTVRQDASGCGYTVLYTPTSLGIHSLQVLYNDKPCLTTPISLKVYDVNSIQDIVLTKTLPAQGTQHLLNKLLSFQLSAPNRDPADISFTAVGTRTGHTPQLSMTPTVNDSYSLEFKALKPDDYKICVTYKDEHIQGSPFTIPVRSPVKANKVAMYDPVIPLSANKPIELVFDTSQAGFGVLTASVLNSKKKVMPAYVEQVNDEIHRVAFIPKESGAFMVSVLYADRHIGGSPFRVLYQEQSKEPFVCIDFQPDMKIKGLLGSAVYGRNTGRQEATVVQYERGKYQISFKPQSPDTFDLHVYWFDTEVEGSPFEIDMLGMENESSDALVDSVPIIEGENVGMLTATAVGHREGPVPIKLTPRDNGTCSIEFTSPGKDFFDLNVFWNGKLLSGMPVVLPLN